MLPVCTAPSASLAGLYIDEDAIQGNGNETSVWVSSNASNTYALDVSGYPSGTYYIYFEKAGQTTVSTPFAINQQPLISVIDPDEGGGEDYATTAGDPWDMNSLNDFSQSVNFAALGNNDGYNYGINANNDPVWYLKSGWIDTNRYHRLTFRMSYGGSYDVGLGSVARFVWSQNGYNYSLFQTSDDIVVYPGWTTYNIDLRTAALQGGSIGWTGSANVFRIDPLEFPESRYMYLDDIKLCADDAARGTFNVRWRDDKVNPRPTTVAIYADPDYDNTNRNERLLVSGVASTAGNNSRTVNFAGVPSGTYYIYLVADDGVSITPRYATGPLIVYSPPVLTSNFNGALLNTYYPTFSWSPAADATSYGIELLNAAPEPGEANGTVASIHREGIGLTNATSWKGDVRGLVPGRQYWYRVIGWNAYGFVAGFSNPDSFIVPAPIKPDLLTPAADATPLRAPLSFTWSPLVGASSYAIELLSRYPENANGYTASVYRIGAAACPPGVTTFNGDTTYMEAGDYWWRIIAINSDGLYGVFSDARKFTVPRAIPGLTAPVDAARINLNSPVDFTWTVVPGATDYAIELLRNPGALTGEANNAAASVNRIGAAVLPGGNSTTYHGHTAGLASGTYYWRIISVRNGRLWGVFSDQRSFIVP